VKRAAVLAVALFLAACAHDGRTLRVPAAGASAPPLVTTTAPGQTTAAAPIALTSSAFDPGGAIPIEHTCDGAGVSPPLAWGAVPETTVELAITVTDTDARGFVHWVIARLSPNVQALATGVVPDDAVQTKNDSGAVGWTGPCPPKGGGPHHYVFTLYALTSPTGVTEDMTPRDAIAKISNIAGLTATLTGQYQRAT
jgi:Raf kinase inhibitor-like YbhB/YbcL family protein